MSNAIHYGRGIHFKGQTDDLELRRLHERQISAMVERIIAGKQPCFITGCNFPAKKIELIELVTDGKIFIPTWETEKVSKLIDPLLKEDVYIYLALCPQHFNEFRSNSNFRQEVLRKIIDDTKYVEWLRNVSLRRQNL